MSNVIQILTKEKFVRIQAIVTLYFARIYWAARSRYLRNFHSVPANHQDHDYQEPELVWTTRRDSGGYWGGANQATWDWQGYPRLWRSLVYYQYASTSYLCYMILRELLLELAAPLATSLGLAKPLNCYLMGRFSMTNHPKIDRMQSVLIALMHVTWRLLQRYGRRPYELSYFSFLMMTERDLTRFLGELEGARYRRELCAACQKSTSCCASGYWCCRCGSTGNANLWSKATDLDGSLEWAALESEPEFVRSPRGRFFASVLCVRISDSMYSAHYKLRPNRSPRARAKLSKHISQVTYYIWSLFAFVFLIVCPLLMRTVFNDERYLRVYPGCDPELARARSDAHHETPAALSAQRNMSLRLPHQVLSHVVDIMENFLIWIDSGVALLFCCASGYLLNFDILLWWQHLHARIQDIYLQLRAQSGQHEERQRLQLVLGSARWVRRQCPGAASESGRGSSQSRTASSLSLRGGVRKISRPHRGRQAQLVRANELAFKRTTHELRAEFQDFFHQIDKSDLFVSDLITSAVLIWLSLFSFVAHYTREHYVTTGDWELLVRVYILELLAFTFITLLSFNLISLHRGCLRTYKTLCSLMAHDTSTEKCAYLGVLEFFTERKRSAYTLFHTVPYTSTTYLSIFSWSLSCYFLLSSLLRGNRR